MNKKSTLRSVANDYLTHPKSKKGITLIALIITIIILLILAGVTISSLTNSGLFSKTQDAVEKSKKAEFEEQVKLAVMEAQVKDNGELNIATLEEILKNKQNNMTVEKTNGNFPITVSKDGQTVTVNEDGTIGVGTIAQKESDIDEDPNVTGQKVEGIYAKFYTDGTMILSHDDYTSPTRTLVENGDLGDIRMIVYEGLDTNGLYSLFETDIPCKKIVIRNEIYPTDIGCLFAGCPDVEEFIGEEKIHPDINDADTWGCFYGLAKNVEGGLESLDLNGWNIESVSTGGYEFDGANIKNIKITNSYFKEDTHFGLYCSENLESIDLSGSTFENTSFIAGIDSDTAELIVRNCTFIINKEYIYGMGSRIR